MKTLGIGLLSHFLVGLLPCHGIHTRADNNSDTELNLLILLQLFLMCDSTLLLSLLVHWNRIQFLLDPDNDNCLMAAIFSGKLGEEFY